MLRKFRLLGFLLLGLISFSAFQNCSKNNSENTVNTGSPSTQTPVANQEKIYSIEECFPHFKDSQPPSEILVRFSNHKVFINSHMIEQSGLIELDLKNNCNTKSINGLDLNKWSLSNKTIKTSFDEKYILAFLAGEQYSYYTATKNFMQLVLLNSNDYSKKVVIPLIKRFSFSEYKNVVLLDAYDSIESYLSGNESKRKILNLDTLELFELPRHLLWSDIRLADNTTKIYYIDSLGVWFYDYVTKSQDRITPLFNDTMKFDLRLVDNGKLYINGEYQFNNLFYYECVGSPCGVDNYLYTYDIATQKIDAVFKKQGDPLMVSKNQCYLVKKVLGNLSCVYSGWSRYRDGEGGVVTLFQ